MADGFEIRREVFLTATLPGGRKVELKQGALKTFTRGGEEIVFDRKDVDAMLKMFEAAEKG